MIETAIAQAQLMRLTGLDFFPLGEDYREYRKELVKSLCDAAINDAHAVAIVDLCIKYLDRAPKPKQIYDFSAQTADRFRHRSSGECSYCANTGFARTWILRTHEGNGHYREEPISAEQYRQLGPKVGGIGLQHVSEAVVRCQHCNYGRRLAIAEQTERQAS